MAVEKMVMLNVVGRLNNLEEILYEVLKSEQVDMVDAMNHLSKNNALYELDTDDVELVVGVNDLVPFAPDDEERNRLNHAHQLMDYFNIKEVSLKELKVGSETRRNIDALYEETKRYIEEENSIYEELEEAQQFKENMSLFNNVDIDITKLRDMEYFTARFGRLEKAARLRLKENYNHILAAFFHTGSFEGEEVYLAIYPNEVSQEGERILQSLHWIDVPVLEYAEGTAKETVAKIEEQADSLRKRLEEIQRIKDETYQSRKDEIQKTLAEALFLGRLEEAKAKMARSKKFFLLSGWTSETGVSEIQKRLKKFEKISITAVDSEGDNLLSTPPTKLKNFSFFRPFELLIRMYGMPDYNEVDPTIFVGITYMILFGSMFGDVGQGIVFILLGMFMAFKTKNKDLGGVISRLGVSSTFFGFLYGSVFGNEELIPALWIRPFENVPQALTFAIGFGVVLLLFAYAISFYNAIKNRDLYDGLFGEHGLMGFLVFLMLLFMLLDAAGKFTLIPRPVAIGILLLAILMMIFKKPIMAKIMKEEVVYSDGKAGYYIESSFSIIELLISTLSGIVSFIRVGAFAINHVGLFLAFHVLSDMANSGAAKVAVLVIGNIIIIGLEGLIVFIQGLRLEYYELFSRYYSGSGKQFESDTLHLKKRK